MPSTRSTAAAFAIAALAIGAVAAAPALPSSANARANDAAGAAGGDTSTSATDSRVVVAPVDSGINPYHEAFAVVESAVTPAILEELGVDRTIVLGDSYLADAGAGKYDDLAEGDLAWFAGTNIIARTEIATGDVDPTASPRPFLPDDAGDTHGTGVTGSVVAANPEAIVYFVEGIPNEAVAFAEPAVDIVTTSYGFLTAVPLPLEGSYEAVVELGKMHTGATTNDPTLAPADGTGGPWWVLGVAGFEEGSSEGKQVFSGTFPDVVADFTQDLPYCDTCTEGTESVGGTSFATPTTAGVASKVLLEARRAAGHLGGIVEQDGEMVMVAGDTPITTWDLRRAMELGAYVPGTEVSTQNLTDFVASAPVNPVLPATQVGWGVVTPDPEHGVVDNALAYLADGSETEKPAGTCEFMTGVVTLRYAVWDINLLSGSFGQTNALGGSPYVAC